MQEPCSFDGLRRLEGFLAGRVGVEAADIDRVALHGVRREGEEPFFMQGPEGEAIQVEQPMKGEASLPKESVDLMEERLTLVHLLHTNLGCC